MFAGVESYVKFETIKGPRDENEAATLVIKWKVSDIKRAIGLDNSGKHPQDVPR